LNIFLPLIIGYIYLLFSDLFGILLAFRFELMGVWVVRDIGGPREDFQCIFFRGLIWMGRIWRENVASNLQHISTTFGVQVSCSYEKYRSRWFSIENFIFLRKFCSRLGKKYQKVKLKIGTKINKKSSWKLGQNLPESQVENWDKNYQKVKLKIGTKITKKSSWKLRQKLLKSQVENWDKNYQNVKLNIGSK
jgi:hypothetical protein